MAADEVDEVIDYRVETYQQCGVDLTATPQWCVGRHQVIDLPVIQPVVRAARRYRVSCPCCRQEQTAAYPDGFERGRVFGSRLDTLISYLHLAHPLSYERIQRILKDTWGLDMSLGALVNAVKRAETALERSASRIQQQIQQAAVVGSDETGARIEGASTGSGFFKPHSGSTTASIPPGPPR